MNGYSIKLTTGVLMLLIVFALLALVSCDRPRYTADQVIVIAQNYSPDKCSERVYEVDDSGVLPRTTGKSTISCSDPAWELEYAGNSIWEIRKKCHQRETKFYFDEKTAKISEYKP